MKIAFDCDGTLRDYDDKPKEVIVNMLKLLSEAGHHIIVWSGGGKDYAQSVCRACGIVDYVTECRSKVERGDVDVAFDDENVGLALTNIQVVKPKEW